MSEQPETTNDTRAHRYTGTLAQEIEARWQARWEADGTFETPNPAGSLADRSAVGDRPKRFILDMFPYPSGAGLHMGHPLGFTATDMYARYQRMIGHNVLYTMGFDAFGLPAEQYAVQTGQHPAITTNQNIANIRSQLRRLGLSHDQRRSISTTDPSLTLSPIFTFSSLTTPAADDGISIDALSLSTVISDCSAATVSPGLTSNSITATSAKSPMSGTLTSITAMRVTSSI